MDASSGTDHHQRVTLYSDEAALDFAEIHTHSNRFWGWEQAEAYIEFLKDAAQTAADDPGRVADRWKIGLGKFLVKLRSGPHALRGQSSDHLTRSSLTEFYVLRILHSAMDLPRHIDPE